MDTSSSLFLLNTSRVLRRLPRITSRRDFLVATGFALGVAFRFSDVFLLELINKL